MVIFELFLQIMENIYMLVVLLFSEQTARILQQPVSSSNLPLKTHLLFQKFCQGSDNILQGQLGKLFQQFRHFCLWKGGHNGIDLQQTFHLFETIIPLIHLCFTHGIILKSFLQHCDCFSFSHFTWKRNCHTHLQTLRKNARKNDMKCSA